MLIVTPETAARLNDKLAGRKIRRVEYIGGTINFVTDDADGDAADATRVGAR